MTFFRLRSTLSVAIAALTACDAPPARQPAEHPVRWSAELQLDSLAGIDARVAMPFQDTVDVFHYASREDLRLDRNGERGRVTSCLSYLDLSDRGFAPRSDLFVQGLHRIGAVCRALTALKSATASRESHFTGFELDERSLELLPPALSLAISEEDAERVRAAEAAGRSWLEFEPEIKAARDSGGNLGVAGTRWRAELREWARGDFDADGVEDLLVSVAGSMTDGSYESTRLFLLGRTRDGGRLRVLRALQ